MGRRSTSSTKPCNLTMRIWSSTGVSTRAVRRPIERKPAESAARPTQTPSATGRARERKASAAKIAVSSAGSHSTGSRSAAMFSATPPIAATGIHRKNRRSSTSFASAPANSARQSGANAAARARPAAARTPERAWVVMEGNVNTSRRWTKAGEAPSLLASAKLMRGRRGPRPLAPTGACDTAARRAGQHGPPSP